MLTDWYSNLWFLSQVTGILAMLACTLENMLLNGIRSSTNCSKVSVKCSSTGYYSEVVSATNNIKMKKPLWNV